MEAQQCRRAVLRHYIESRFDGNVRQFSLVAGKADRQLNDMLAGRKPFGEKVARDIEKNVGLAPLFFDDIANANPDNAALPTLAAQQPAAYIINDEARALADIYIKLPNQIRGEFRAMLAKSYIELCLKHPEIDASDIGTLIDFGRK